MPLLLYDACVVPYVRIMGNMSTILDKAATFIAEKKVEEGVLLDARLYPTMWSAREQVHAVASHGTRGPARLSGQKPPQYDGPDGTIAALKTRLAWAIAFANGLPRNAFDGAEEREIVFPAGGKEQRLSGRDYLFGFSIPNFMFHATTAYDILRHNGVPLVKDDFVGQL